MTTTILYYSTLKKLQMLDFIMLKNGVTSIIFLFA